MADYKTPGVFVKMVKNSHSFLQQEPNGIPGFVGYSAQGVSKIPVRITSLHEFERIFGRGPSPEFSKAIVAAGARSGSKIEVEYTHNMFDSVDVFFAKGGGECHVVSVGMFGEEIELEKLQNGMDILRSKYPDITVVVPELSFMG
jgi:hypothetical protein